VRTETQTDGSVTFAVSNSGPTVSPELRDRLTEPFVRGVGRVGTRAGGPGMTPVGSGLGLALVARVAEVHGAHLGIVARPAGGLDVTVRFPGPPGSA